MVESSLEAVVVALVAVLPTKRIDIEDALAEAAEAAALDLVLVEVEKVVVKVQETKLATEKEVMPEVKMVQMDLQLMVDKVVWVETTATKQ